MEYVGRTILGEERYQHAISDNCTIYCNLIAFSGVTHADFIVGLPGATSWLSQEESKSFRLGIEGDVEAFTEKPAKRVTIAFENGAYFGDFYADNGTAIKKMLRYQKKIYMYDDGFYYEVTSDNKDCIGFKSHETFIGKDEEHKFQDSDIVSQKEKFSNIFLEMFENIR